MSSISQTGGDEAVVNFMNTTNQKLNNITPSTDFAVLPLLATGLVIYVQPIICITGFIGNFISVIVFLSKHLRKASSNIYLTGLSITSCVFCICLFVVWLEVVNVTVIYKPVLCQMIVCVTYVSSFLTVWFVVCITFENYIVTVHTTRAINVCTVTKAKITVSVLSALSMLIYCFTLWTTESNGKHCRTRSNYQGIVMIFTYIDTAISLIIPSFTMLLFISAIFIQHICSKHSRNKKMRQRDKLIRISKKDETLLKITRVLLAISVSYVVFGAPMYISKIRNIILSIHKLHIPSRNEMATNHICLIVYYFTFTLNVFYYLKWSANYRKGLMALFVPKRIPRCEIETKVISIPLVQLLKKSEDKEITSV